MVHRAVVTGANHVLGRAIVHTFSNDPLWQVHAIDLETPPSPNALNVRECNLTDETQVKELIQQIKPDVLIHAMQTDNYLDVEESEKNPDRAHLLHVKTMRNISKICSASSCWVINISTDQIFDGNHGPYASSSEVAPVNLYGKLKREAELALWEYQSDAGILRVPLLYGSVTNLDEIFVTQIANNLLQKKPLQIDNNHVLYPTFVNDIGTICKSLAERKIEHCGLNGTWHWSGTEAMTAYQLALKVADVLGVDASLVTPHSQETPQRPHNPQLNCIALEVMGIVAKRQPFTNNIAQILQQHKQQ